MSNIPLDLQSAISGGPPDLFGWLRRRLRNEIGLKARINSLPRQPKQQEKPPGRNGGVEVLTGCVTWDRSLW